MNIKIFACALLLGPTALFAQSSDFEANFQDSTLRLDYVIAGVPGDVNIAMRHMTCKPSWAGRKGHLAEVPYTGNGDVTVTSMQGDTLYRNSFSTLFNEWLDLKKAEPMAQECVLLIPYPKDTVVVTVNMLDKYHQPIATARHTVDPADILIHRQSAGAQGPKWDYVHKGEYDGPKVKVAIMAEGYTLDEMDTFRADAQAVVDAMWTHEPFASMKDRFDFIAVESPSAETGVSVPLEGDWKSTAFNSHFSTFYSDRYLTSPSVFAMHDALAQVPADHIIILANTDVYGGGGIFNAYTLTTAHHPNFAPVVVHEFGHSFGGLTDEYFYEEEVMADTYPIDVEPWEPNITTLVDFDSKWKEMIPADVPQPTSPDDKDKYPLGLFEGGGYSFHGIYRPAFDCRMRTNTAPAFCPCCQAALEKLILFYTDK